MLPRHWHSTDLDCYANHMLKRIFVGFGVTLLAGSVLAQAYRWVDEDGVVHFSDRPVAGAEQIELPATQPNAVPRRQRAAPTTRNTSAEPAAEQPPFSYDSIEISAPAAEETLWNIAGILNVNLGLQPALRPGHQIRVYFDGEPRTTVNSTSFQLDEVWRGAHNIQAEVLDEAGNMIIRSLPNRFYVQQTRVN